MQLGPEIPEETPESTKRELVKRRRWFVIISVLIAIAGANLAWTITATLTRSEQNQQQLSANEANGVTNRRIICIALNNNARQSNKGTDYITDEVIQGVKDSKPFTKTYDALGLPSYETRLARAHQIADELRSYKVKIIPCDKFAKNPESVKGLN